MTELENMQFIVIPNQKQPFNGSGSILLPRLGTTINQQEILLRLPPQLTNNFFKNGQFLLLQT
ncbi:MAG: hypothetical protein ACLFQP_06200 [Halothece sp.]